MFLFQVKTYIEVDEFLKRASGTRAAGSSSSMLAQRKDAALKNYLPNLDPIKVIHPFFVSIDAHNERLGKYESSLTHKMDLQMKIFHKGLSNSGAKFPLFAMKVLSQFCGGYGITKNAEKIILI